MTQNPTKEQPKAVIELTCHDAQQLVEAGEAVFLDVREKHEYLDGHIDGVPLLPSSKVDYWEPDTLSFLESDHVILICRSGWRSRLIGEELYEKGYTGQLYNMTEGILGWQEQGCPMIGKIL